MGSLYFYNRLWVLAFACIVIAGCNMQIRGGKSAQQQISGPFASVALTSPNGGENLAGGTVQNITWNSSSLTGTTQVTLSYSTDGGATWIPIAGPIADTGSYAWTVPALNSPSIQIQVELNNSVAGSHTLVSNSNFTIDSIIPTVAITSPSAGAIINTNNQSAFTVIGTCSENGRNVMLAAGAVNNSGGCIGGAFSIALNVTSLTDGTVTVTADHADAAGNTATQQSRNFTKETVRPAVPTVALSHPTTASTTNTNVALNNLSITGDTDAVKWCVIEQLSTDAAPAAPAVNDACFVGTRPTTHTLSGRGVRRLYVYTLDTNDNRSLNAATDDLDFPLPTVIELTGPTSIPQSGCSDPLQVVFKDSYGMDSFFSSATTVTLSGGSTFYSDAGCLAANNITSIGVGAGQVQSAKFYFKSSTLGALTLQASAFSTSDTLSTSVDVVNAISTGGGLWWAYEGRSTCLIQNGAAQCSGYGYTLGNNNRLDIKYGAMTSVNGLGTDVTDISVGAQHSCAVQNGAAVCWGRNGDGQLGNGNNTSSTLPAPVSGLGQGVRQISASNVYSYSFSCALVGEAVRCWGDGSEGQLGNGTTSDSNVPVQVTGLTSGVTAVATGEASACAIQNGALKCWGNLCTSTTAGNCNDTTETTPITLGGLTSGVTQVTMGIETICVVHNGAVKCLGDGLDGLLGDGTSTDSSVPVAVPGMTANINSIAVARGIEGLHACAVQNGALKCWGDNYRGQFGETTEGDQLGPTTATYLNTNVKQVAAGSGTTCVTLNDNSFRCVGSNLEGEFGSGGPRINTVPVTAPELLNATQVSLGDWRNCLVDTAGKLKCWGHINPWRHRNTPWELESSLATSVSVGVGWYPFNSCEVHNGGVKCFGAWGTNEPTSYISGLGSGSGATAVGHGLGHRCAIVAGGVQCWGDDQYGQLGNGAPNPGDVNTPVTAISTAAGVTHLAVGDNHSCAINSAGALQCWGENGTGKVGDGSTTNRNSPVTVYANNTTSIAAGSNHTCAVRSGAAYCWGYNYYGQLGDGTGNNSTTPVAVLGLGSGVSAVFARASQSCAILTTGALKCWGKNDFGQLGNAVWGQNQVAQSPVDVIGMNTAVTQVAMGVYGTCAQKSGTWKCWGSNMISNSLGDGEKIYFEDASQPITVGLPAELALTGPATSTAGVCSTAFTVTLKDSDGITRNAFTNLTVTLHEPGTGNFYDSAGCGGAPVSQITITTGNSSGTFYYMAPSAQQVGIQVRAGTSTYRLIPAGMKHDVL